MSGGSSFGSSSSSSASGPWRGQQPYLKDLFGQAQNLYNEGVPAYYPGATYTPFNDIQQQAFGGTVDRAGGSPEESAFSQYLMQAMGQPQFNLGGVGQQANQAAGGIGAGQQFMFNQGNPFTMGQSADITGMNPAAQDALTESAGGGFLNANPYLDAQFNRASEAVTDRFGENVMPGINATFGSAGRTGSGLHQASVNQAGEDVADAIGNMATDIYGGNYAAERQNQLGAAGRLGDLGLGSKALGADLFNAGQNRALQAGEGLMAGGLGGINSLSDLFSQISQSQQGAAGMTPAMSDLQYQNLDRLLGVGDTTQGLSERVLQDDINRFNYYQQAPQDLLQRYAEILLGQQFTQNQSRGSSFNTSASGGMSGGGGAAAMG